MSTRAAKWIPLTAVLALCCACAAPDVSDSGPIAVPSDAAVSASDSRSVVTPSGAAISAAELETDLRIRPYRNNWTMPCDITLTGDGTATLSWDSMQGAPVQVCYLP